VIALTNAVTDAAEDLAMTQPGGRLAVPLVGVLDEIANVCRWRELPGLYSHYGSRGIILMSILQSWAQGVGVWGKEGMDALWSATNVAIYGGNIKDRRFLEDLSALIGTYDKTVQSISTRATGGMWSSGAQMSTQIQREAIMDVADLAALPKGRAVVFSSGNRPTLVETLPWMTGPRSAEVKASYEAHDPQAAQTLREAAESLAQVQAQLAARGGGEDR
jgi:type IV secretory pathway TraG/TraD family ATPase VirD4